MSTQSAVGRSVLKDWCRNLSLAMQGTLLTAVRGPDNVAKDDACKYIVRTFRAVVLHNAYPYGPNNTFAGDGNERVNPANVRLFFSSVDQYPHHWLLHMIHAGEIVAYMHPDEAVRDAWDYFYRMACEDMHVTPETRMRLLARLGGHEYEPTPADRGLVEIDYTNHRGERKRRVIQPRQWFFGERKPWYPTKRWLLEAWDEEKKSIRTFDMAMIHEWASL